MKVRHKVDKCEWDYLGEWGDYFVVYDKTDPTRSPQLRPKYQYELDEPRWQDVTGECKLPYNFATSSDLGCMIVLKEDTWPLWGIKVPTDGIYRLRKVMLSPQHGVPAWQWAFLVERKVE